MIRWGLFMNISSENFKNLNKQKSKRFGKYNAKKVKIGDKIFDSKLEASRYQKLCLLEKTGIIKNLVHHKVYDLKINNISICKYEADFVYNDSENNLIVEDSKGFKTKEYIIKKKLMKAIYDIDIYETYKA